ncbi:hypothetical protein [Lysinibacillus sp. 54212]|uniref:hypothetical protein n=1 Tax=Lysinibacillus sp. 54212 TaxID=3119829 RepID=UPI002FCC2300
MKKRLKKKLGNQYNVLKRAKREKFKRRGYRCIDYAMVPIGINDRLELDHEGYILDYPYATHWFAQLSYTKVKSPIKNVDDSCQYVITVFPCNKSGGTHTSAPIYIYFYKAVELKIIISIFNKFVGNMINDCFWKNTS